MANRLVLIHPSSYPIWQLAERNDGRRLHPNVAGRSQRQGLANGSGKPSMMAVHLEEGCSIIDVAGLDQLENRSWKNGPDALRSPREAAVDELMKRFGVCKGQ